uniref:Uncharacterized protein n=1 Tax=Acrobeloides nanus TaxID=290746 RepID=A0A914EHB0_9BILA
MTRMFHASKAKINIAEIASEKTPSSPTTSKEILKDPETENRISPPTSLKDRRQSKDVTYWIPRRAKYVLGNDKQLHRKQPKDALEVSLSAHIESFQDFDEEKKLEASFVWRKLAQYVITHMKRGYVEGLVKEYNTSDISLIQFNKNNVKL